MKKIPLKSSARKLRSNMTDCEKIIWKRIRKDQLYGIRFYRQRILGNYIVDFYAASIKLVIEIDGQHHYAPEYLGQDKFRDKYFNEQGIHVLRIKNQEVTDNLENAIQKILKAIKKLKV